MRDFILLKSYFDLGSFHEARCRHRLSEVTRLGALLPSLLPLVKREEENVESRNLKPPSGRRRVVYRSAPPKMTQQRNDARYAVVSLQLVACTGASRSPNHIEQLL